MNPHTFAALSLAASQTLNSGDLMRLNYDLEYNPEYRLVYRQFMGGVAPRKIAKEFNISRQRVHDIVKIYSQFLKERDSSGGKSEL